MCNPTVDASNLAASVAHTRVYAAQRVDERRVVFRRCDHRHSLPHHRGPKSFLRVLHTALGQQATPNPTSGPVPC
jgi:hypothetical protein